MTLPETIARGIRKTYYAAAAKELEVEKVFLQPAVRIGLNQREAGGSTLGNVARDFVIRVGYRSALGAARNVLDHPTDPAVLAQNSSELTDPMNFAAVRARARNGQIPGAKLTFLPLGVIAADILFRPEHIFQTVAVASLVAEAAVMAGILVGMRVRLQNIEKILHALDIVRRG